MSQQPEARLAFSELTDLTADLRCVANQEAGASKLMLRLDGRTSDYTEFAEELFRGILPDTPCDSQCKSPSVTPESRSIERSMPFRLPISRSRSVRVGLRDCLCNLKD